MTTTINAYSGPENESDINGISDPDDVDSIVSTLQARGVDCKDCDLSTEEGRRQAAVLTEDEIVAGVNRIDSLRGTIDPDQAKAALQELSTAIRGEFTWLRRNANLQQVSSLLSVGTPLGAIPSHLSGVAESGRFNKIENYLEAFFALVQRSGLPIPNDLQKIIQAAKVQNPNNITGGLVSIFCPWVRGIHRMKKVRKADELQAKYEKSLDEVISFIDSINSSGQFSKAA